MICLGNVLLQLFTLSLYLSSKLGSCYQAAHDHQSRISLTKKPSDLACLKVLLLTLHVIAGSQIKGQ